MPSADLPNLGPAATMTDSNGAGHRADAGSFASLLQQRGDGLRAAPGSASQNNSKPVTEAGDALGGAPLALPSLQVPVLPPVEAVVRAGSVGPHHQADPGRLPPGPPGEILPPIGNALPHASGSPLSAATALAALDPHRSPALASVPSAQDSAVAGKQKLTDGPRPYADQRGESRRRSEVSNPASRVIEFPRLTMEAIGGGTQSLNTQAALPAARPAVQAPKGADLAGASAAGGNSPELSHGGLTGDALTDRPAAKAKVSTAAIQAAYDPALSSRTPLQQELGAPSRFAESVFVGSVPGAQAPLPSGAEAASSTTAASTGSALSGSPASASRTVEAPIGSASWGTELAGHLRSLAVEGNVQRAELRLNPAHLGAVEVRLSLRGDETSVTFVAAEGVVRDALQETLPRLRELLAEQGLNLGQARVLDHHSANLGDREAPHRQTAESEQGEATESQGSETGLAARTSRPRSGSPPALVDAYI